MSKGSESPCGLCRRVQGEVVWEKHAFSTLLSGLSRRLNRFRVAVACHPFQGAWFTLVARMSVGHGDMGADRRASKWGGSWVIGVNHGVESSFPCQRP